MIQQTACPHLSSSAQHIKENGTFRKYYSSPLSLAGVNLVSYHLPDSTLGSYILKLKVGSWKIQFMLCQLMNEARWAHTCINNFKLIFYYSLNTVIDNYSVGLFFFFHFVKLVLHIEKREGVLKVNTTPGKCPYLVIMPVTQHSNKSTWSCQTQIRRIDRGFGNRPKYIWN